VTRIRIDKLLHLACFSVCRPNVSVKVVFPLENLRRPFRIFATRVRAVPDSRCGMLGVKVAREVFLVPKAASATCMGALEREVMFLVVCVEKMTLSKRFRTCSAPVQRRFIKNEGRRVKLELWRFVEFVIECEVL